MISQTMHALLTTVCLASILYSGSCHFAPKSVSEPSSQTRESTKKERVREDQVTALLRSEFGNLFRIDDRNISPSYLVGDFNGDGVEDIAVSAGLDRQVNINDKSKPPFFFEKVYGPGPSTVGEERDKDGFALGALARYQGLAILLVIHGSPRDQWNNTEQMQRFVVVDGWQLGKKTMSLYQGRKLKPTAYGDEPSIIPPPQLLGDAILMLNERNVGTAVYWDGVRYRWYPVDQLP